MTQRGKGTSIKVSAKTQVNSSAIPTMKPESTAKKEVTVNRSAALTYKSLSSASRSPYPYKDGSPPTTPSPQQSSASGTTGMDLDITSHPTMALASSTSSSTPGVTSAGSGAEKADSTTHSPASDTSTPKPSESTAGTSPNADTSDTIDTSLSPSSPGSAQTQAAQFASTVVMHGQATVQVGDTTSSMGSPLPDAATASVSSHEMTAPGKGKSPTTIQGSGTSTQPGTKSSLYLPATTLVTASMSSMGGGGGSTDTVPMTPSGDGSSLRVTAARAGQSPAVTTMMRDTTDTAVGTASGSAANLPLMPTSLPVGSSRATPSPQQSSASGTTGMDLDITSHPPMALASSASSSTPGVTSAGSGAEKADSTTHSPPSDTSTPKPSESTAGTSPNADTSDTIDTSLSPSSPGSAQTQAAQFASTVVMHGQATVQVGDTTSSMGSPWPDAATASVSSHEMTAPGKGKSPTTIQGSGTSTQPGTKSSLSLPATTLVTTSMSSMGGGGSTDTVPMTPSGDGSSLRVTAVTAGQSPAVTTMMHDTTDTAVGTESGSAANLPLMPTSLPVGSSRATPSPQQSSASGTTGVGLDITSHPTMALASSTSSYTPGVTSAGSGAEKADSTTHSPASDTSTPKPSESTAGTSPNADTSDTIDTSLSPSSPGSAQTQAAQFASTVVMHGQATVQVGDTTSSMGSPWPDAATASVSSHEMTAPGKGKSPTTIQGSGTSTQPGTKSSLYLPATTLVTASMSSMGGGGGSTDTVPMTPSGDGSSLRVTAARAGQSPAVTTMMRDTTDTAVGTASGSAANLPLMPTSLPVGSSRATPSPQQSSASGTTGMDLDITSHPPMALASSASSSTPGVTSAGSGAEKADSTTHSPASDTSTPKPSESTAGTSPNADTSDTIDTSLSPSSPGSAQTQAAQFASTVVMHGQATVQVGDTTSSMGSPWPDAATASVSSHEMTAPGKGKSPTTIQGSGTSTQPGTKSSLYLPATTLVTTSMSSMGGGGSTDTVPMTPSGDGSSLRVTAARAGQSPAVTTMMRDTTDTAVGTASGSAANLPLMPTSLPVGSSRATPSPQQSSASGTTGMDLEITSHPTMALASSTSSSTPGVTSAGSGAEKADSATHSPASDTSTPKPSESTAGTSPNADTSDTIDTSLSPSSPGSAQTQAAQFASTVVMHGQATVQVGDTTSSMGSPWPDVATASVSSHEMTAPGKGKSPTTIQGSGTSTQPGTKSSLYLPATTLVTASMSSMGGGGGSTDTVPMTPIGDGSSLRVTAARAGQSPAVTTMMRDTTDTAVGTASGSAANLPLMPTSLPVGSSRATPSPQQSSASGTTGMDLDITSHPPMALASSASSSTPDTSDTIDTSLSPSSPGSAQTQAAQFASTVVMHGQATVQVGDTTSSMGSPLPDVATASVSSHEMTAPGKGKSPTTIQGSGTSTQPGTKSSLYLPATTLVTASMSSMGGGGGSTDTVPMTPIGDGSSLRVTAARAGQSPAVTTMMRDTTDTAVGTASGSAANLPLMPTSLPVGSSRATPSPQQSSASGTTGMDLDITSHPPMALASSASSSTPGVTSAGSGAEKADSATHSPPSDTSTPKPSESTAGTSPNADTSDTIDTSLSPSSPGSAQTQAAQFASTVVMHGQATVQVGDTTSSMGSPLPDVATASVSSHEMTAPGKGKSPTTIQGSGTSTQPGTKSSLYLPATTLVTASMSSMGGGGGSTDTVPMTPIGDGSSLRVTAARAGQSPAVTTMMRDTTDTAVGTASGSAANLPLMPTSLPVGSSRATPSPQQSSASGTTGMDLDITSHPPMALASSASSSTPGVTSAGSGAEKADSATHSPPSDTSTPKPSESTAGTSPNADTSDTIDTSLSPSSPGSAQTQAAQFASTVVMHGQATVQVGDTTSSMGSPWPDAATASVSSHEMTAPGKGKSPTTIQGSGTSTQPGTKSSLSLPATTLVTTSMSSMGGGGSTDTVPMTPSGDGSSLRVTAARAGQSPAVTTMMRDTTDTAVGTASGSAANLPLMPTSLPVGSSRATPSPQQSSASGTTGMDLEITSHPTMALASSTSSSTPGVTSAGSGAEKADSATHSPASDTSTPKPSESTAGTSPNADTSDTIDTSLSPSSPGSAQTQAAQFASTVVMHGQATVQVGDTTSSMGSPLPDVATASVSSHEMTAPGKGKSPTTIQGSGTSTQPGTKSSLYLPATTLVTASMSSMGGGGGSTDTVPMTPIGDGSSLRVTAARAGQSPAVTTMMRDTTDTAVGTASGSAANLPLMPTSLPVGSSRATPSPQQSSASGTTGMDLDITSHPPMALASSASSSTPGVTSAGSGAEKADSATHSPPSDTSTPKPSESTAGTSPNADTSDTIDTSLSPSSPGSAQTQAAQFASTVVMHGQATVQVGDTTSSMGSPWPDAATASVSSHEMTAPGKGKSPTTIQGSGTSTQPGTKSSLSLPATTLVTTSMSSMGGGGSTDTVPMTPIGDGSSLRVTAARAGQSPAVTTMMRDTTDTAVGTASGSAANLPLMPTSLPVGSSRATPSPQQSSASGTTWMDLDITSHPPMALASSASSSTPGVTSAGSGAEKADSATHSPASDTSTPKPSESTAGTSPNADTSDTIDTSLSPSSPGSAQTQAAQFASTVVMHGQATVQVGDTTSSMGSPLPDVATASVSSHEMTAPGKGKSPTTIQGSGTSTQPGTKSSLYLPATTLVTASMSSMGGGGGSTDTVPMTPIGDGSSLRVTAARAGQSPAVTTMMRDTTDTAVGTASGSAANLPLMPTSLPVGSSRATPSPQQSSASGTTGMDLDITSHPPMALASSASSSTPGVTSAGSGAEKADSATHSPPSDTSTPKPSESTAGTSPNADTSDTIDTSLSPSSPGSAQTQAAQFASTVVMHGQATVQVGDTTSSMGSPLPDVATASVSSHEMTAPGKGKSPTTIQGSGTSTQPGTKSSLYLPATTLVTASMSSMGGGGGSTDTVPMTPIGDGSSLRVTAARAGQSPAVTTMMRDTTDTAVGTASGSAANLPLMPTSLPVGSSRATPSPQQSSASGTTGMDLDITSHPPMALASSASSSTPGVTSAGSGAEKADSATHSPPSDTSTPKPSESTAGTSPNADTSDTIDTSLSPSSPGSAQTQAAQFASTVVMHGQATVQVGDTTSSMGSPWPDAATASVSSHEMTAPGKGKSPTTIQGSGTSTQPGTKSSLSLPATTLVTTSMSSMGGGGSTDTVPMTPSGDGSSLRVTAARAGQSPAVTTMMRDTTDTAVGTASGSAANLPLMPTSLPVGSSRATPSPQQSSASGTTGMDLEITSHPTMALASSTSSSTPGVTSAGSVAEKADSATHSPASDTSTPKPSESTAGTSPNADTSDTIDTSLSPSSPGSAQTQAAQFASTVVMHGQATVQVGDTTSSMGSPWPDVATASVSSHEMTAPGKGKSPTTIQGSGTSTQPGTKSSLYLPATTLVTASMSSMGGGGGSTDTVPMMPSGDGSSLRVTAARAGQSPAVTTMMRDTPDTAVGTASGSAANLPLMPTSLPVGSSRATPSPQQSSASGTTGVGLDITSHPTMALASSASSSTPGVTSAGSGAEKADSATHSPASDTSTPKPSESTAGTSPNADTSDTIDTSLSPSSPGSAQTQAAQFASTVVMHGQATVQVGDTTSSMGSPWPDAATASVSSHEMTAPGKGKSPTTIQGSGTSTQPGTKSSLYLPATTLVTASMSSMGGGGGSTDTVPMMPSGDGSSLRVTAARAGQSPAVTTMMRDTTDTAVGTASGSAANLPLMPTSLPVGSSRATPSPQQSSASGTTWMDLDITSHPPMALASSASSSTPGVTSAGSGAEKSDSTTHSPASDTSTPKPSESTAGTSPNTDTSDTIDTSLSPSSPGSAQTQAAQFASTVVMHGQATVQVGDTTSSMGSPWPDAATASVSSHEMTAPGKGKSPTTIQGSGTSTQPGTKSSLYLPATTLVTASMSSMGGGGGSTDTVPMMPSGDGSSLRVTAARAGQSPAVTTMMRDTTDTAVGTASGSAANLPLMPTSLPVGSSRATPSPQQSSASGTTGVGLDITSHPTMALASSASSSTPGVTRAGSGAEKADSATHSPASDTSTPKPSESTAGTSPNADTSDTIDTSLSPSSPGSAQTQAAQFASTVVMHGQATVQVGDTTSSMGSPWPDAATASVSSHEMMAPGKGKSPTTIQGSGTSTQPGTKSSLSLPATTLVTTSMSSMGGGGSTDTVPMMPSGDGSSLRVTAARAGQSPAVTTMMRDTTDTAVGTASGSAANLPLMPTSLPVGSSRATPSPQQSSASGTTGMDLEITSHPTMALASSTSSSTPGVTSAGSGAEKADSATHSPASDTSTPKPSESTAGTSPNADTSDTIDTSLSPSSPGSAQTQAAQFASTVVMHGQATVQVGDTTSSMGSPWPDAATASVSSHEMTAPGKGKSPTTIQGSGTSTQPGTKSSLYLPATTLVTASMSSMGGGGGSTDTVPMMPSGDGSSLRVTAARAGQSPAVTTMMRDTTDTAVGTASGSAANLPLMPTSLPVGSSRATPSPQQSSASGTTWMDLDITSHPPMALASSASSSTPGVTSAGSGAEKADSTTHSPASDTSTPKPSESTAGTSPNADTSDTIDTSLSPSSPGSAQTQAAQFASTVVMHGQATVQVGDTTSSMGSPWPDAATASVSSHEMTAPGKGKSPTTIQGSGTSTQPGTKSSLYLPATTLVTASMSSMGGGGGSTDTVPMMPSGDGSSLRVTAVRAGQSPAVTTMMRDTTDTAVGTASGSAANLPLMPTSLPVGSSRATPSPQQSSASGTTGMDLEITSHPTMALASSASSSTPGVTSAGSGAEKADSATHSPPSDTSTPKPSESTAGTSPNADTSDTIDTSLSPSSPGSAQTQAAQFASTVVMHGQATVQVGDTTSSMGSPWPDAATASVSSHEMTAPGKGKSPTTIQGSGTSTQPGTKSSLYLPATTLVTASMSSMGGGGGSTDTVPMMPSGDGSSLRVTAARAGQSPAVTTMMRDTTDTAVGTASGSAANLPLMPTSLPVGSSRATPSPQQSSASGTTGVGLDITSHPTMALASSASSSTPGVTSAGSGAEKADSATHSPASDTSTPKPSESTAGTSPNADTSDTIDTSLSPSSPGSAQTQAAQFASTVVMHGQATVQVGDTTSSMGSPWPDAATASVSSHEMTAPGKGKSPTTIQGSGTSTQPGTKSSLSLPATTLVTTSMSSMGGGGSTDTVPMMPSGDGSSLRVTAARAGQSPAVTTMMRDTTDTAVGTASGSAANLPLMPTSLPVGSSRATPSPQQSSASGTTGVGLDITSHPPMALASSASSSTPGVTSAGSGAEKADSTTHSPASDTSTPKPSESTAGTSPNADTSDTIDTSLSPSSPGSAQTQAAQFASTVVMHGQATVQVGDTTSSMGSPWPDAATASVSSHEMTAPGKGKSPTTIQGSGTSTQPGTKSSLYLPATTLVTASMSSMGGGGGSTDTVPMMPSGDGSSLRVTAARAGQSPAVTTMMRDTTDTAVGTASGSAANLPLMPTSLPVGSSRATPSPQQSSASGTTWMDLDITSHPPMALASSASSSTPGVTSAGSGAEKADSATHSPASDTSTPKPSESTAGTSPNADTSDTIDTSLSPSSPGSAQTQAAQFASTVVMHGQATVQVGDTTSSMGSPWPDAATASVSSHEMTAPGKGKSPTTIQGSGTSTQPGTKSSLYLPATTLVTASMSSMGGGGGSTDTVPMMPSGDGSSLRVTAARAGQSPAVTTMMRDTTDTAVGTASGSAANLPLMPTSLPVGSSRATPSPQQSSASGTTGMDLDITSHPPMALASSASSSTPGVTSAGSGAEKADSATHSPPSDTSTPKPSESTADTSPNADTSDTIDTSLSPSSPGSAQTQAAQFASTVVMHGQATVQVGDTTSSMGSPWPDAATASVSSHEMTAPGKGKSPTTIQGSGTSTQPGTKSSLSLPATTLVTTSMSSMGGGGGSTDTVPMTPIGDGSSLRVTAARAGQSPAVTTMMRDTTDTAVGTASGSAANLPLMPTSLPVGSSRATPSPQQSSASGTTGMDLDITSHPPMALASSASSSTPGVTSAGSGAEKADSATHSPPSDTSTPKPSESTAGTSPNADTSDTIDTSLSPSSPGSAQTQAAQFASTVVMHGQATVQVGDTTSSMGSPLPDVATASVSSHEMTAPGKGKSPTTIQGSGTSTQPGTKSSLYLPATTLVTASMSSMGGGGGSTDTVPMTPIGDGSSLRVTAARAGQSPAVTTMMRDTTDTAVGTASGSAANLPLMPTSLPVGSSRATPSPQQSSASGTTGMDLDITSHPPMALASSASSSTPGVTSAGSGAEKADSATHSPPSDTSTPKPSESTAGTSPNADTSDTIDTSLSPSSPGSAQTQAAQFASTVVMHGQATVQVGDTTSSMGSPLPDVATASVSSHEMTAPGKGKSPTTIQGSGTSTQPGTKSSLYLPATTLVTASMSSMGGGGGSTDTVPMTPIGDGSSLRVTAARAGQSPAVTTMMRDTTDTAVGTASGSAANLPLMPTSLPVGSSRATPSPQQSSASGTTGMDLDITSHPPMALASSASSSTPGVTSAGSGAEKADSATHSPPSDTSTPKPSESTAGTSPNADTSDTIDTSLSPSSPGSAQTQAAQFASTVVMHGQATVQVGDTTSSMGSPLPDVATASVSSHEMTAPGKGKSPTTIQGSGTSTQPGTKSSLYLPATTLVTASMSSMGGGGGSTDTVPMTPSGDGSSLRVTAARAGQSPAVTTMMRDTTDTAVGTASGSAANLPLMPTSLPVGSSRATPSPQQSSASGTTGMDLDITSHPPMALASSASSSTPGVTSAGSGAEKADSATHSPPSDTSTPKPSESTAGTSPNADTSDTIDTSLSSILSGSSVSRAVFLTSTFTMQELDPTEGRPRTSSMVLFLF
ncbi:mucin-17-like [Falco naumanni]|uniref:mucin-17-like n=1 Tax=Falco naumanni TaxID=148594 RepID=UPI001ADE2C24|nr:mucin-17-like [Falco naumanni]